MHGPPDLEVAGGFAAPTAASVAGPALAEAPVGPIVAAGSAAAAAAGAAVVAGAAEGRVKAAEGLAEGECLLGVPAVGNMSDSSSLRDVSDVDKLIADGLMRGDL